MRYHRSILEGLYVLDDGGNPVVEHDPVKWSMWMFGDGKRDRRTIAYDQIGDLSVSTVFLAIDHNWGGVGLPVLFETMIFGGKSDQYCDRYCTRREALEGHLRAKAMVTGQNIIPLRALRA